MKDPYMKKMLELAGGGLTTSPLMDSLMNTERIIKDMEAVAGCSPTRIVEDMKRAFDIMPKSLGIQIESPATQMQTVMESVKNVVSPFSSTSVAMELEKERAKLDASIAAELDNALSLVRATEKAIETTALAELNKTKFEMPEIHQAPVYLPPPPRNPDPPDFSLMFLQFHYQKLAEHQRKITDKNQVVIRWWIAPNGESIQIRQITRQDRTSLDVVGIDRAGQVRTFFPEYNALVITFEITDKSELWSKNEDTDDELIN